MRATILLSILGTTAAAARGLKNNNNEQTRIYKQPQQHQNERALSGDMDFDDDFWTTFGGDMDTVWDDYSIDPKKCMIYKNEHVIAFNLYGKGNNQCAKKLEGTYIMDVGKFAKAYVGQMTIDYQLKGNEFGGVDAIDYTECTAVEYNDVYYYAKLGCTTQGGIKIMTYSDESCYQEINQNIGLYNDLKIQFNVCQACVSWPVQQDDDAAEEIEVDDNFDSYHMYDSKLCGAADMYKQDCKWGCKKEANKAMGGGDYNTKKQWGGFDKFCLFFWSFAAVALVWVVLKQRRMMSREDAIVEEAAMNGIGLKKRHVFPIALGMIFFILLGMFMVWKKFTWILLMGTNLGLFAHFVYLRRKAKRAGGGAGGEGYIKDAGLEIS